MEARKNKALFLDRDGVVCKILDPAKNGGYLTHWEEFELVPGIKELIKSARAKGYKIFIVSNQPQIAKNLISEEGLAEIHSKMQVLLDNEIDRIYYCPHVNEDGCDCRKPKPGMLFEAAKDFNVDLASSIMVGDADKDILAGQSAGCKTVFVKNEFKKQYLANCSPDFSVEDLKEIVRFI